MAKEKKEKKTAGFNTPFKGLKLRKPTPAPGPPKPAPPHPPAAAELSDEALFTQAMAETKRIEDPRGFAPPPVPGPLPPIVDDEAEALARLTELVSGQGAFDIADTGEFIEGAAPGVNGQLMAALRRGDYAIQGHVDLHGKTRVEAKEAVVRFLAESRRQSRRCVLIVHGRGLNSKDQIPVLKEQLNVWLRHGSLARAVLAFCTARPHDGGAGALYVLLRK